MGHRTWIGQWPVVRQVTGRDVLGRGAAVAAPADQAVPARFLALFGVATELAAATLMERRMGLAAEPYRRGRGGA